MQKPANRNIVSSWPLWHFYQMPRFLLGVWKNYLEFGMNYFSIPLLLVTLFSPWRKYHWSYPRGFDAMGYLSAFISNMFSRLMGALSRFLLIIVGIFAQALIVVAGIIAIILWLLLPFIILLLIWILYAI